MAIEGLKLSNNQQPPATKVDDETVEVAVKALGMLVPIKDEEQVAESVRRDFEAAAASGVNGEPYIQVPYQLASLGRIVKVLDEDGFRIKYGKTIVADPELWTPGTGLEAYTQKDLSRIDGLPDGWLAHGRIAVHNTAPSEAKEPLLHFTDFPYDRYAKVNWDRRAATTQLKELTKARRAFEAEHPDHNMVPLNFSALSMLILIRMLKGEPVPEHFAMVDANLPRKAVSGCSVVGSVAYSGKKEYDYMGHLRTFHLEFASSQGIPDKSQGVGASVGRREV